jgi:hypothetical protein
MELIGGYIFSDGFGYGLSLEVGSGIQTQQDP